MAEVQIDRVSPKHDQIINWLIANPGKKRRECAEYFNISEPWLSVVTNSEVFKARLADRQDAMFGLVAMSVTDKITYATDLALDRLAEKIPVMESPKDLVDTTEMLLKAQGYGNRNPAPPAGNLTITVSANVLAEARDRMTIVQAPMALPGPSPVPEVALSPEVDIV